MSFTAQTASARKMLRNAINSRRNCRVEGKSSWYKGEHHGRDAGKQPANP
jgi:hypothetical protein